MRVRGEIKKAPFRPKGENVKGHVLRFLGMYNVMDLLTFTIAMDILASSEIPADGEWVDALTLVFAAMVAILSGVGMWLSTITYNAASAVHDHRPDATVCRCGVPRRKGRAGH